MRFTTHLSDNHKRFNELTIEKLRQVKVLATAAGEEAAEIAAAVLEINAELDSLRPLLDAFPCGNCEASTPIKEKVEVGIGWGTVERGDASPIFLDRIVGLKVKGESLGLRLCHACAVEMRIVTVEELEKT